jgi:hypothetical protein
MVDLAGFTIYAGCLWAALQFAARLRRCRIPAFARMTAIREQRIIDLYGFFISPPHPASRIPTGSKRLMRSPAVAGSSHPVSMTTFLLLVLGVALFGALAGYVIFCDRV